MCCMLPSQASLTITLTLIQGAKKWAIGAIIAAVVASVGGAVLYFIGVAVTVN